MNTRPSAPASRPAHRQPRPVLDNFGNPVEAATGPQKVVYWGESGAIRPRDPVAERAWALATLAMLFVVTIAAVGPLIPG